MDVDDGDEDDDVTNCAPTTTPTSTGWFLRKANSELGVGWRLQKIVELCADACGYWNCDLLQTNV